MLKVLKKQENNHEIRTKKNSDESLPLSLHRTEALFDGILAIAMTLLVLDIEIPNHDSIMTSGDFLLALGNMHLTFIKYFTSFFILASLWIANNKEIYYLHKTNKVHMWLNLTCMFFIVLIPFTTSVQDDFSSILFAPILFHINIFLIEFISLLRWLYIRKNKDLTKKDIATGAVFHKQINRCLYLMIIPLLAVIATFVIGEYSNLLYILFFFVKRRF